jgi:AcrR family transcriptional regulator
VQSRTMNRKHSANAREEKRAAILQAASQVFARKGYATAALEEVARKAGLAKGTLYLYFKDKEALYLQTVLHVLESLQADLLQQVERQPQGVQKLRAFASCQLAFFARNRDTLRLFADLFTPGLANLHKRLIGPMLEKHALLIAYLSRLVDEGKRQGEIRRDLESQHIALGFLGMVNQASQSLSRMGLAERALESPAEDSERVADTIMRILMEGISS